MANEEAYTFEKGEHDDFSPEVQPKGSYRKAVNFIRDESGQLITERGSKFVLGYPSGFQECGVYNLNGNLIVCLVSFTGFSCEIGIIEEGTNTYVSYISNISNNNPKLLLSSNKLGFLLSSPIDIEAKYNYLGEIIVYLVDGVNTNKRINLSNLPDDDGFEEEVQLQFSYSVPRTIPINITNDGELLTGTYVLGARYLTSGGNSTSIGILTPPIKITDDSVSSVKIDGAPPQSDSSKAITVRVENLDSNYPFVEIVAITYIGVANTPKYSIVGRVESNNSSTLTFRYFSNTQIAGSLIDEDFTIQPVVYKTARHIQQKDNILLLSGLTAESFNEEVQTIANSCEIFYDIEKLPFNESMTSTVDGLSWAPTGIETSTTSFNKNASNVEISIAQDIPKDYRNELVATLKVGYMREEVYSFAIVPIFTGGTEGFAYHIPGFNTSSIQADVASKRLGTYLSSEVYPSGKGYPSGRVRHHLMPFVEQENTLEKIGNTLYIRVLKIKIKFPTIPTELKAKLQGFKIVRQKRDIANNRSVVLQGVGKRIFKTGTILTPVPSSGQMSTFNVLIGDPGNGGTYSLEPNPFCLYAPDSLHKMISSFSFTHSRRIGKYSGERVYDSRVKSQDCLALNLLNYNEPMSVTGADNNNLSSLEQDLFEMSPFDQTAFTLQSVPINKGFTLPFTGVSTTSYVLSGSNQHLVFCNNGTRNPFDFNPEENYFDDGANDAYQVYVETPKMYIANIYNKTLNQYGKIEEAEYIECDSILFSIDGSTNKTFFGGDTYITKSAIIMGDNAGANLNAIPMVKSINYCFLETIGNYGLKHYEANNEDGTLSLPYFPKYTNLYSPDTPLGLFNYSLEFGHSLGYNKQYSKEKDVKIFISKPLLFVDVTDFLNRTIRSEVSFEGELADNFRVFLPNNFQDVPKDKGVITNTFVWNDKFYIHTERGLFLTYINTREQILTDVSQIVIGTGGVFAQPPTELFDIEGGYVGTTSKWAGVVTPFGYFFIINSRGRVMQLIETVKEISDIGKAKFFNDNIEVLQDSPIENIGFIGGFDYLNSRYFITKLGDNGFTYSFFLKLNSWTGSHTYQPKRYINRDKQLLISNGQDLYEVGKDVIGSHLGNQAEDSQLILSLNFPLFSKKFDAISIGAKSIKNNVLSPFDFFKYIDSYTLDQRTGKTELVVSNQINPVINNGQVKVSYKGREYRFSIPLDSVKELSRNLDIFADENLDISKKFKGRMLGGYLIIDMTTSLTGSEDFELFLNYLKLTFRSQDI